MRRLPVELRGADAPAGGAYAPTRRRGRAVLALLLAASVVSGCGFQLRGTGARVALPAVALAIERARTPLGQAVSTAVAEAMVGGVVADAAAARYRVEVSDQREERRSRTLTRGIQVAEYELTVALDLVVEGRDGDALAPRQRLVASRVYARQQENLLTNEAEEDVLWAELRRDVAAQVVTAVQTQIGAAETRAQP